jgi:hypothetical protein
MFFGEGGGSISACGLLTLNLFDFILFETGVRVFDINLGIYFSYSTFVKRMKGLIFFEEGDGWMS